LQTRNKGKPEVAKDYFNEDQILYWFTQICLALKHCHDRKILHRDIKAGNIFLMKSGLIKLGDFGIARVLQSTTEMAATVVGTPYYLSPEIVQSNTYDFKTDIWSIGVLLYEMCALRPPFNGQNLHQLAIQIVSGTYPPIDTNRYSMELSKLIQRLL
jgi:NIMA (never in mitosis gene a)-related kinase